MPWKELASATAIALTLSAYYPYVRGILRGTVRPHVFSWVIWGFATLVVFFAQLQGRGGAGAYAVGVSALITIGIAVLAWMRRADVVVTRTDWLFFVVALTSLPLWYLTAEPLVAVVILTVVDLLGFGPTVRKAWSAPYSENLPFYVIFVVRNGLVVLAMETWSLTTLLFPAAIGLGCLALALMIVARRRVLPA